MADPQNLINVVDPDTGEVGSIPQAQLSQASSQGYRQATPEDLQPKESGGSSLFQQAVTGLEGLGNAASLGTLPAFEQSLGIAKPEEIMARREQYPGTHMLGQAASLLLPTGEAEALGMAGKAASGALGLGAEGAGLASNLGAKAIQGAVETGLFQAQDENAKLLTGDPSQSVGSAISSIGLASLLGAGVNTAFGVASPLWKASSESKLGEMLSTIGDKIRGVPAEGIQAADTLAANAGIELSPELKASISDHPTYQKWASDLQDSQSGSALSYQQGLKDFYNKASTRVGEIFGKSPEQLEDLKNFSERDLGQKAKESIVTNLKSVVEPVSNQFDSIAERFKATPISDIERQQLMDSMSQIGIKEGFTSDLSPAQSTFNKALKEIPKLKNLEDLRMMDSNLSALASSEELWHAEKVFGEAIDESMENITTRAVSAEAPELLGSLDQAKAAWKEIKGTINDLNQRIKVGTSRGPKGFIARLERLTPEQFLSKLSPEKDANFISILSDKFPEAAEIVKNYHIDDLLKTAVQKAPDGSVLNTKTVMTKLEKMSPELRNWVASPEAQSQLSSLQQIIEQIPSKKNFSGTAGALDRLQKHFLGAVGFVAAILTGHSPLLGVAAGEFGRYLGREAPEALKLSLLKYAGATEPMAPSAFKSMFEFIHHTIQGENLISKAAKNIFDAGRDILPQSMIPDQKDLKKLDSHLKDLQKDPTSLTEVGGDTGHYLPQHQTELAQMAVRASTLLNSLRPPQDKKSPLDSEPQVSKMAKAKYDQALTLAQQPLTILNDMKKGTMTVPQVQLLNALYPGLKKRLDEKLTSSMMDHLAKGKTIPYQTRLGLSTFLGQPLDSTMTPASIQATQIRMGQMTPSQQQAQPRPHKVPQNSFKNLPSLAATPSQSREMHQVLK